MYINAFNFHYILYYFSIIQHFIHYSNYLFYYLVDLTMYAARPHHDRTTENDNDSSVRPESRPLLLNRTSIHDLQDMQLYSPQSINPGSNSNNDNNINNNNNNNNISSPIELNNREVDIDMSNDGFDDDTSEQLRNLVTAYRRSLIALEIKDEIDRVVNR